VHGAKIPGTELVKTLTICTVDNTVAAVAALALAGQQLLVTAALAQLKLFGVQQLPDHGLVQIQEICNG
jgi:hypothetical protein